jgi:hypothetical protein
MIQRTPNDPGYNQSIAMKKVWKNRKEVKMKESLVKNSIVHYLQMLENQGRLYFIRNNTYSGYLSFSPTQRGHYTRQGKIGCSDIIIFMKDSVIFCECKSDTGEQSVEQKDFQKKIEALEYYYIIVRSLDDLISVFRDMNFN